MSERQLFWFVLVRSLSGVKKYYLRPCFVIFPEQWEGSLSAFALTAKTAESVTPRP